MVQARWALALILLLVALPAQGVGAALWKAEDPEYEDEKGESSQDTSKVLREILRELKTISRGVNSLHSSVDSRRLSSTAVGRANPLSMVDRADTEAVESKAEPDAVEGRAGSDAVRSDDFQSYCIEGIVAVLGSMLLGVVLCCVFHVWRKRRKRLEALRAMSQHPASQAEARQIFSGLFK